jgi:colicin import membrane protein
VTATHEIAIQLSGDRRAELRRFLVASAVAHLGLLVAFAYSPAPRISVPLGVVAVELVAAPPGAAPPARVVPPPALPKPAKPKKIVLPAEPTTPKLKPKPEKPKVIAKVDPPVKPAPAPEKDYEDVLAQLRAEIGESAPPAEAPSAAPAVAGPVGSPNGVAISPEVAAWLKRAKIHVRKNWVVPPGFRTQALEAQVQVDLGTGGQVRGTPRVTMASGNPWYDEGVIRAIQKSSPLPAPPEAGKWTFVFLPEDSY